LAAQYQDKLEGECFNIASGQEITNNQILDILGKKFTFCYTVSRLFRAGDVMRTCPSIEKAKNSWL
jgi:hypothetical protein